MYRHPAEFPRLTVDIWQAEQRPSSVDAYNRGLSAADMVSFVPVNFEFSISGSFTELSFTLGVDDGASNTPPRSSQPLDASRGIS